MVIDKGLGLSQTGDLLELAGPYIDYMKSGPHWARIAWTQAVGLTPGTDPTAKINTQVFPAARRKFRRRYGVPGRRQFRWAPKKNQREGDD